MHEHQSNPRARPLTPPAVFAPPPQAPPAAQRVAAARPAHRVRLGLVPVRGHPRA